MTLAERIETAFDRAIELREQYDAARLECQYMEMEVKLEHADEWAAAKNGEVRAVLLEGWLAKDEDYAEYAASRDNARWMYRKALLEIERLKLLVALAGKGA